MDYRTAYEALSVALWAYDKAHNDAYVRLMLEVRRIDTNLGKTMPPITLAQPPTEGGDE